MKCIPRRSRHAKGLTNYCIGPHWSASDSRIAILDAGIKDWTLRRLFSAVRRDVVRCDTSAWVLMGQKCLGISALVPKWHWSAMSCPDAPGLSTTSTQRLDFELHGRRDQSPKQRFVGILTPGDGRMHDWTVKFNAVLRASMTRWWGQYCGDVTQKLA